LELVLACELVVATLGCESCAVGGTVVDRKVEPDRELAVGCLTRSAEVRGV
jgi:hypothetical protein